MRWLIPLVLAQNVNVTPIETRQNGVRVPQRVLQRQYVIDCRTSMTCGVDGGVLYLSAASSGGGYDGGKVGEAYLADAAGFAGIAGYASTAGTADAAGFSNTTAAFATNPTDCAATEYATAIDSAGNLTCSTPPAGGAGSSPLSIVLGSP